MPITQARVLALISAADAYKLRAEQILETAETIVIKLSNGSIDYQDAMFMLDLAKQETQVSAEAIEVLTAEKVHFKIRKADNDRRRVKQSIRRFAKRNGTEIARGVASTKLYDERIAPPPAYSGRTHSEENRGVKTTAPEGTPWPDEKKFQQAHRVALATGEAHYTGVSELQLEIAQREQREEERAALKRQFEEIARGEKAKELGVKTEKEEIAKYTTTPDPEAYVPPADGEEDGDEFGGDSNAE